MIDLEKCLECDMVNDCPLFALAIISMAKMTCPNCHAAIGATDDKCANCKIDFTNPIHERVLDRN